MIQFGKASHIKSDFSLKKPLMITHFTWTNAVPDGLSLASVTSPLPAPLTVPIISNLLKIPRTAGSFPLQILY